MIYDHTHPGYIRKRGAGIKTNGAYWYSVEIVKNIIPKVKTDRPWVTINCGLAEDGAIVFIHNNIHAELYDYLRPYKDLILVCGVPKTCDMVRHLGTPIYLPLSVDVEEVKRHRRRKTNDIAYAGRRCKPSVNELIGVPKIYGKERGAFLDEVAKYRRIYAVGRAAIEAKVLGCKVLPFDLRFPDPEVWQVVDNSEAAEMLQKELKKYD